MLFSVTMDTPVVISAFQSKESLFDNATVDKNQKEQLAKAKFVFVCNGKNTGPPVILCTTNAGKNLLLEVKKQLEDALFELCLVPDVDETVSKPHQDELPDVLQQASEEREQKYLQMMKSANY